jgi:hypothetical protein
MPFIFMILKGQKKLLKLSQLSTIEVPKFQELTAPFWLNLCKKNPHLAMYIPD